MRIVVVPASATKGPPRGGAVLAAPHDANIANNAPPAAALEICNRVIGSLRAV